MSKEPAKKTGLDLLREPFPDNQISKLPKPTKQQTDAVRADYKKGIRCDICGQWHHPNVVHLDYVGHAALTDRLLECDPKWNWEPLALDEHGMPFYQNGGMWIKLTVCGVTRLGFGDAEGKKGGNAIKEIIGDALRNAAMRFGAALDLWHKGELHQADDETPPAQATVSPEQYTKLRDLAVEADTSEAKLCEFGGCNDLQQFPADKFDSAIKKLNATIAQKPAAANPPIDDEIPNFEKE